MTAPPNTAPDNIKNCVESELGIFTIDEESEYEAHEKRTPQVPIFQLLRAFGGPWNEYKAKFIKHVFELSIEGLTYAII